ncbi:MAG TPA: uroporphyrinogen decarboxylase family protein [Spirochaetota bacterium]|nr:uroporphyrinogen decarboxylase family protein [Spirochaetota bacterium]
MPLKISEHQLQRFESLYKKYKTMYQDPARSRPLFLINVEQEPLNDWHKRFEDPALMLQRELESLETHLLLEDDYTPTVRVQFGTVQVAAAFGTELDIPPDNYPTYKDHILKSRQDIARLEEPALNTPLLQKLAAFTAYFKEHLPDGIHIQHPDIQSALNTAHILRGTAVFMDFYDDPAMIDKLLDIITAYMIKLVPYLKKMISNDREWFFDWGGLWKGRARISNCSAQMISPELYTAHILPRDIQLMHAIGGGRMHYCGTSYAVIERFFENPLISAIDFDGSVHDLFQIALKAPDRTILFTGGRYNDALIQKLLAGEWPAKRNLVLKVTVPDIKTGKKVLNQLRQKAATAYNN